MRPPPTGRFIYMPFYKNGAFYGMSLRTEIGSPLILFANVYPWKIDVSIKNVLRIFEDCFLENIRMSSLDEKGKSICSILELIDFFSHRGSTLLYFPKSDPQIFLVYS